MKFRVLGPLELADHGDDVPIQGTKQRAVLGFLLLNANRVVSTSALMDALWPVDEVPNTARKILHNAIWGLRGALTPRQDGDGRPSLITRPPGYILQLDPETVDLYEFRRLAGEGRAQLADGYAPRAVAALRQAVGLWRGAALADLVEAGFDWPELAGLENARIDVLEDYFDAELALGRHHSVLREIEASVEAGTLRERLCGQLMLALYRCGRHTDALSAYHRMRSRLVEQLGLEPGRSLQRLQQAILCHDDSLLSPSGQAAPSLAAVAPVVAPVVESVAASAASVSAAASTAGSSAASVPASASGAVSAPPSAHEHAHAAAPEAGVESARVSLSVAADSDADTEQDVPSAHPVPGEPVELARRGGSVVMVQAGVDDRRAVLGDGEVARGLNAVADALRYAAESFGGTVAAPAGPALLAVFSGAEAPKRAVSTALALLEPGAHAAPAIAVRAAVVTGETRLAAGAGPDAAPVVSGPVLDTGRTLMAHAAPGTVRVCARTRGVPGVSCARSGGASSGWRARSVQWRSLAHPDLPIVDRDFELDVLCGLLGRSRHRSVAQLVTVLGDGGVGKTRLALEFERRAMARWDDAEFLVAGPEAAGRPLGLLRDLLLALCGTPPGVRPGTEGAPGAGLLRQIAYGAIADQTEAAEVGAGVVELVSAGEQGPAPHRVAPLLDAGRRLLGAVALDHPLVVFVDDAHDLDDASLDFLEQLITTAGPSPLMLIVAARPELLRERPGWGCGHTQATTLTLPSLTDATVDRLSDLVLARLRQGQLTLPTRWFGETFGEVAPQGRRRRMLRMLMRLDTVPPTGVTTHRGLRPRAPASA